MLIKRINYFPDMIISGKQSVTSSTSRKLKQDLKLQNSFKGFDIHPKDGTET